MQVFTPLQSVAGVVKVGDRLAVGRDVVWTFNIVTNPVGRGAAVMAGSAAGDRVATMTTACQTDADGSAGRQHHGDSYSGGDNDDKDRCQRRDDDYKTLSC